MPDAFLPVFLFVLCALGLAVGLVVIASLLNSGRSGRVARMPYESGMDPVHDTRRRFDVRFHLVAIAFLVFDVELLFLYPWAVATGEARQYRQGIRDWGLGIRDGTDRLAAAGTAAHRQLPAVESPIRNPQSPIPASRSLVFGGAMTFLALLTLGFVYDWRKGVFRWR
jgi:NADH-quinone oxidoreductase subunit A